MGTRLDRKTALVTGATSNIGRAIAIAFAREGAHVVLSGRNEARAAEALRAIHQAGGRADFVQSTLDGSPETSRRLAEEATRLLGARLDSLATSACIDPRPTTITTHETPSDQAQSA